MKLLKKFMRKDKGFSLVEVMCAVVLLAIIATPIIQVAFSSLSTNVKARRYLAASDVTSDTMEFISSLTFEEYSYKDGAVTKYVPGLKQYYWGADEDFSISDSKLYLVSSGKLYPGYVGDAVTYSNLSGNAADATWKKGEQYRTLKITNVKMDGIKFDVVIDMKNTLSTPTEATYYTYDVEVSVYEAGKSKVLSSAKTSIANKY